MGPAERDSNLVGAPMWAPDIGWETKKKEYAYSTNFLKRKTGREYCIPPILKKKRKILLQTKMIS